MTDADGIEDLDNMDDPLEELEEVDPEALDEEIPQPPGSIRARP